MLSMLLTARALLLCLIFTESVYAAPSTHHPSFKSKDYSPLQVIKADYLVLGGGASGTYAAVRLKDSGKSVVVVERDLQLGGHTYTYVDPKSGAPSDVGVVAYKNISVVTDFFNRFDVPLTPLAFGNLDARYADFAAGTAIPATPPPSDYLVALQTYFQTLSQWPYLDAGWNLTYPVPDDLMLPFGDFLAKYNLQAAASTIFRYAQSVGNLLDQTTIYVAKYFGLSSGQAFASGGYLTTAHHYNSELYAKALAYLGASNVLLNSYVMGLKRSNSGVFAVVATPSGLRLIQANTLVSSIPPVMDNLACWDLSNEESKLFGKFSYSGYYTALVTDTGLDNNISYTNVQPSAPMGLPRLPQAYDITPTVSIPNVFHVYYASPEVMSEDQVKAAIVADVNVAQKLEAGLVQTPSFVLYKSHAPYLLQVSPYDIQNKFYDKLYKLQGKKNTFWTGAAWHTHDTALLWRFTESILPGILGQ